LTVKASNPIYPIWVILLLYAHELPKLSTLFNIWSSYHHVKNYGTCLIHSTASYTTQRLTHHLPPSLSSPYSTLLLSPLPLSSPRRHQTLMTLSSWSTIPLEEVASSAPGGYRWFQLYVYKVGTIRAAVEISSLRAPHNQVSIRSHAIPLSSPSLQHHCRTAK
jgi:hypothetical protein